MTIFSETSTTIPHAQHDSSKTANQNNRWTKMLTKSSERPWFIWFISIIDIIVFIVESGISWSLTGSPIQIKPSFNLWIGPSVQVLIYMGARYGPCMYEIKIITDDNSVGFLCPNYTGSIDNDVCSLSEACGFDGASTPPNQRYRLILPIFLHAGVVHITFNLFSQLTVGAKMEKKIGTVRVAIIYFASSIFGNIISANFISFGFASIGCSGSLFGIFPLLLLDIVSHWQRQSCSQLIGVMVIIVVSFGFGVMPSIDNFGHIGGFLMGLLLGIVLMKPANQFRSRREIKKIKPATCQTELNRFFHKYPAKYWAWWLLRLIFFAAAIVLFVFSIQNIYLRKIECSWCQYINCLPIGGWCDIHYLTNSNRTL